MTNQTTRRGSTQEVVNAVNQNKVILNLIQDLTAYINKVRSRIKYGMTPFFNNSGYVEDPQLQPLGMTALYNPLIRPSATFPLMGKSTSAAEKAYSLLCPSAWRERMSAEHAPQVVMRGQVRGFSGKCTPSGFILRPSSSRSVDVRGYSGRIGFTLIELLVVVLIIGILAAVALPQYQKAVMKSRLSSALRVVDVANKAMALYVLENGYPDSVDDNRVFTGSFKNADLALDIPCDPGDPSDESINVDACNIRETPFYLMVWANLAEYSTVLCFDPMCDYNITIVTNKEGKRTYRCMYLSDTEFSPYCQLAQELMPGERSSLD